MVQDIVGRREIEQGILWLDEMGKKDSCLLSGILRRE